VDVVVDVTVEEEVGVKGVIVPVFVIVAVPVIVGVTVNIKVEVIVFVDTESTVGVSVDCPDAAG
jgi:hypothetical protein